MINYVKNILCPEILPNEPVVIPHVVNNIGVWGKGFTKSLSVWPQCLLTYQKFCNETSKLERLGKTSFAEVNSTILVANMCCQNGIGTEERRLRYDCLVDCMRQVKHYTFTRSIYCPKFGSGLAGGNWEFIEELIKDIWGEFNVYVYGY